MGVKSFIQFSFKGEYLWLGTATFRTSVPEPNFSLFTGGKAGRAEVPSVTSTSIDVDAPCWSSFALRFAAFLFGTILKSVDSF